jgi:UDPglucose 6-dehydrogenase
LADLVVIGMGYVGLVTAGCFAHMGHRVICLDIDTHKIEMLKKGLSPIFEPGLEALIQEQLAAGRLYFTSSYQEGLSKVSGDVTICFIAVSTPSRVDGSCDSRSVLRSIEQITEKIEGYHLVIIKSTVPVGTCAALHKRLEERGRGVDFDLLSNPEFLREGSALNDSLYPERIIIGADHPRALPLMQEIYAPLRLPPERFLVMSSRSAEMTKYAANAMLANRISFMNELSGLAEHLGAHIDDIRRGIGSDSRIGEQFLYAGIGYGGSCFPKDLRALRAMAREVNYDTPLLNAVEAINQQQKKILGKKLHRYFQQRGGVKGKTIAIWGLSFKPNTDDIREAPALELVRDLLKKGAILRLYDPASLLNVKKELEAHANLHFCTDEYDAAAGAHAIALTTEWQQFRSVNFEEVGKKMEISALFDGRNQFQEDEMKKQGFDYFGIGISC